MRFMVCVIEFIFAIEYEYKKEWKIYNDKNRILQELSKT